tara:strand:+ start:73 stop:954 length:882 start_codon:yes stop_codon:yes gene_type:complete
LSKPDFIFRSYALKTHLEKNEQKFDIGSYLKLKNEETDKLISSLNSDFSSLDLFQKFNYIKDILWNFIFYENQAVLKDNLNNLFTNKWELQSVLTRLISIKDLMNEVDKLEAKDSVVYVSRYNLIKLTELYIYFSLYPYILNLVCAGNEKNKEKLLKEMLLSRGLHKRLEDNSVDLDKIRGDSKGRVSLLNLLEFESNDSCLNSQDLLLMMLKSIKSNRKAYDTLVFPVILQSIVFSDKESSYSVSPHLISIINLICKTTGFFENEEDWLNANSPDKSYVSYCYKSISNHFFR